MPERMPQLRFSSVVRDPGEVALPLHLHRPPGPGPGAACSIGRAAAPSTSTASGEEIVARLVESGRLADVADYYTLAEEELASFWTWAA